MRLSALVFAFLATVPFSRGALEFKTTKVELPPPEPNTRSVSAEFPFKNTGTAPVTILETHSSCGCTVAEIDAKVYAPGKTGKLRARFDLEGRQGPQLKQITLRTSDGDHLLTLSVELPQRILITPRLRVFHGEEKSQTFAVSFRADVPVKKVELTAASPSYQATLITKTPGQDYEVQLSLAPNAPAELRETLYIKSTGASGVDYTDSFFLRRSRD